jgi:hypothetical protein
MRHPSLAPERQFQQKTENNEAKHEYCNVTQDFP